MKYLSLSGGLGVVLYHMRVDADTTRPPLSHPHNSCRQGVFDSGVFLLRFCCGPLAGQFPTEGQHNRIDARVAVEGFREFAVLRFFAVPDRCLVDLERTCPLPASPSGTSKPCSDGSRRISSRPGYPAGEGIRQFRLSASRPFPPEAGQPRGGPTRGRPFFGLGAMTIQPSDRLEVRLRGLA